MPEEMGLLDRARQALAAADDPAKRRRTPEPPARTAEQPTAKEKPAARKKATAKKKPAARKKATAKKKPAARKKATAKKKPTRRR